ncbi:MAG: OmpA family protein [Thermodesulfovibrio sp.]|uniref:OmpA/MotB family protein n=1 Tax=unclassified Thermodesulfovibrio TaxID=2645936 RepID=UPI0008589A0D|nr:MULTISPECIES: OmpA family protein [unclassified Thermodesulfovibrio]MDI1472129.1 OmpA family protein [Thermodesulfovibrio sp. 1176]MDI6715222.1 OmpA family protein [Thermodesulfovibrio sp.]ODA45123.1 Flagellar motor rotation protein MotB [Thermodesulfovibrio sp. N1]
MKLEVDEKESEEKENHDRWLISWADFLTLLFTFFVALYALSTVDKQKAEDLSVSLKTVFKIIDPPIKKDIEKPDVIKELEKALSQYPEITIRENHRGYVITVQDTVLFKSGEYELNESSKEVLNKIVVALKMLPNKISIEGHTDNIPVKGMTLRSNWDLSALRALSVLYYFKDSGISPDRLSATGYGEYRPISDNETEEGRAKNRRVEIVLLR